MVWEAISGTRFGLDRYPAWVNVPRGTCWEGARRARVLVRRKDVRSLQTYSDDWIDKHVGLREHDREDAIPPSAGSDGVATPGRRGRGDKGAGVPGR
jgi:hypothetical protein